MKLLKLGVFLSMLLMTPVLEAQNTSVSLWEENIEQLSMDCLLYTSPSPRDS